MKKVYGSYLNNDEARNAINNLLQEGYTRDEIKVVSNQELDEDLNYTETHSKKEDESIWEKIIEPFTSDNDDVDDENYFARNLNSDERDQITGYESNLHAGEIVLLLEDRVGMNDDKLDNDFNFNKDPDNKDLENDFDINKDPHNKELDNDLDFNRDLDNKNLDNEENVMELKKEKLNVDKEKVQTGEVDVKKVVKKETQTVEVPVEKEEIVIERKSAGDREVGYGDTFDSNSFEDGDDIHIPIKEERVNVTKDTVVDDEVVVKKVKHTDNETVTEDLKHEDIEVDGDARIKDDLDRDNR